MSTSTQLNSWAEKYIPKGFLGVFAADRLPEPDVVATVADAQGLTSLICNYDPHDLPGSHWVACRIEQHSVAWFDSYGLAPDADDLILGHTTHFAPWLTSVCQQLKLKSYTWSTLDLQSLAASTCGHYALWYCRNGPTRGWEGFGSDTTGNDSLIRELVRV